MKLFLKILFFLLAIFQTNICEAKVVNSLNPVVSGTDAIMGFTSTKDIYDNDQGYGMASLNAAVTILPFLKWGKFVKGASAVDDAAKGGSTTLYRAVSKAELDDIAQFGLRNKAGAYETGKLFAPTAREAAQFGRNNFMFDGIPNTLIKVKVPNSVMNNAYMFGADGMNAISIPSNQFPFLRATQLNYSPFR